MCILMSNSRGIFSALPSPKILEIYPICLRIFGIGSTKNLSAIDASAE